MVRLDIGWVVGHSYIVYGPLFTAPPASCTRPMVGTPDAGAFWAIAKRWRSYRADRLRAIKKEDGGHSSGNMTCQDSAHCSWPASAPADGGMGGSSEGACDRSLVETETGWHRQQSGGRHAAGQHGSPTVPMPLSGRRRRRGGKAGGCRYHGFDRDQIADAAGLSADAVAAGGALQGLPLPSPATTRPRMPATG